MWWKTCRSGVHNGLAAGCEQERSHDQLAVPAARRNGCRLLRRDSRHWDSSRRFCRKCTSTNSRRLSSYSQVLAIVVVSLLIIYFQIFPLLRSGRHFTGTRSWHDSGNRREQRWTGWNQCGEDLDGVKKDCGRADGRWRREDDGRLVQAPEVPGMAGGVQFKQVPSGTDTSCLDCLFFCLGFLSLPKIGRTNDDGCLSLRTRGSDRSVQ